MSGPLSKKTVGLVLLAIVLLAVLLRIPSLFMPLHNLDEAVYAVIANGINDGALPYRDAVDHKPPVPHYLYALLFSLFGRNNMDAVHGFLMLLIAAVILLIYRLARLGMGQKGALFSSLFFAGLSAAAYPGDVNDMYAANTEWFLILFTTLASFLVVRGWVQKQHPLWTAVAGVTYGLAFFSKQPALFDGFAAFCVMLYLAFFCKDDSIASGPGPMVRYALLIFSGFAAVCVLVVGFFALQGAWSEFFFGVFTYNSKYYVPAVPLLKRILKIPIHFSQAAVPMNIGAFALAGWVIVGLRLLAPGKSQPKKINPVTLFFALWAFFAFLAATLSGRSFGHYYIQFLPAWCLLAGMVFDAVFAMGKDPGDSAGMKTIKTALVAFLVFTMFATALVQFFEPIRKSIRESRITASPSYDLAAMLKQNSPEGATIFVWGFWPQIYVWADRDPGARYAYCNFLTGLIPWTNIAPEKDTSGTIVPGSMGKQLEDLTRNKPRFIVDTSPGDYSNYRKYPIGKFPPLAAFIKQHYQPDREIRDPNGKLHFRVYRIKGFPLESEG